jgi:hypothetical protein
MNKKTLNKALTTAVLILMGAGIGFIVAKFGMDSAKTAPTSQVIALIILFLPAFFLVIGIHEGGHAIAGTSMKFDFRMYIVGPFMWDKEESGWKFKWNKNVNLSGGLVICLPTTTENLAKRFSIYALGGPAASLIFTGVAYSVKQLIELFNINDNFILNLTGSFFGLISFLSLLIFIITIIPLHNGGFYTDGARALRFLRGGDTARFETLLMKIITSSSGGIRPRLLNMLEINEALSLAKKLNAPMKVYLLFYFYQFAFDGGNFDEAEKHLKEYISESESIPKGIRGSVFLDAAFFYAFARKDLAQAEVYWKQYEPSAILPKAQVFATEAVMCSLKGDETTMNTKIDLALKELPNMMDRGVGVVLREKLNQFKELRIDRVIPQL